MSEVNEWGIEKMTELNDVNKLCQYHPVEIFKRKSMKITKEIETLKLELEQFIEKERDSNLINKIVCGDSLQILQKLPDESIDLIVTSPPYNIGMEYDKYNDRKEQRKRGDSRQIYHQINGIYS